MPRFESKTGGLEAENLKTPHLLRNLQTLYVPYFLHIRTVQYTREGKKLFLHVNIEAGMNNCPSKESMYSLH